MKFFMNLELCRIINMVSDLKPVIQYSHEHLDPFSVVFLYSNRIGFIPLSDPTSRIYRGICTRNSIYLFFILIPLNFNPIETDSFNFIFTFFAEHERFLDFRYSKTVTYLTYLTQFICNQSSFRFWWTCESDVVQSGQDKRTAFGRFFTFLTLKRTLAIEHLFIKTNSSFKKHHISNTTKFIFQYLRLKFFDSGDSKGWWFFEVMSDRQWNLSNICSERIRGKLRSNRFGNKQDWVENENSQSTFRPQSSSVRHKDISRSSVGPCTRTLIQFSKRRSWAFDRDGNGMRFN